MAPRSQLIFDKSDSIRSRTKECKNLRMKKSELKLINGCRNLANMNLNSLLKTNPNGSLMWT